ncbi:MAG: hypothetical protein KUA36_16490 [Desulfomicrobium sp.]|nr:hypothetical protein [Pseudomonadota bacterium]MBV1749744.1 hypothetical protein [Desulfomicrobium sp.]
MEARDDEANEFIPKGVSVWEFGTNRNINQKANEDFGNRKDQPGVGITPTETTFMFVTPRRWLKKQEWEEAKRQKGPWRDVRAYDAEDLELWLESSPAVGAWWAKELGFAPPDAISLNDWWEEWSGVTDPVLTPPLILAGRENETRELGKWIEAAPSILTLKSLSPDESVAFFAAFVQNLPDDQQQVAEARTFISSSQDFLRQFAPTKRPHIVVALQAEIGIASSLARYGHHILLCVGNDAPDGGQYLKLDRPAREPFINQLKVMGLGEDQCKKLADSTGRSFSILRRRLAPSGMLLSPEWALPDNGPLLIPALLANKWDEHNKHDRQVLAELGGRPYEELSTVWARWRNVSDSPFTCVGSLWKLISTEDAWTMLARFLTGPDLDRFEHAVQTVLGMDHPKYELEPDKRWYAALYNKQRPYSDRLIEGLAHSINRMGTIRRDDAPDQTIFLQSRARSLVQYLLYDANGVRWASLARCLPDLAEASPLQFLAALGHSLAQDDPPVMKMFTEVGFMGASTHTNLLWALETLAWFPEHFGRVALALAQLSRLDPGGQMSNRPGNSLQSILLPIAPQSTTTQEQRIETLRMLHDREPEAFWKVVIQLLPDNFASWTDNPRPTFREDIAPCPRTYSLYLLGQEWDSIVHLILEKIAVAPSYWNKLWQKYPDLSPHSREITREKFQRCIPDIKQNQAACLEIVKELRNLLEHHRSFPDAEWALPDEELKYIETIFHQIEPDGLYKHAWLFVFGYPEFFDGGDISDDQHGVRVQTERESAVLDIFTRFGFQGLIEASFIVEEPSSIGFSLRLIEEKENIEDAMCSLLNEHEESAKYAFATGYIRKKIYPLENKNFARLAQKSIDEQWNISSMKALFRQAPTNIFVWDLLEEFPEEVQTDYWNKAYPNLRDSEEEDILYAFISYLQYGNAAIALKAIAQYGKFLPSGVLVQILECILRHQDQAKARLAHMQSYYIDKAFKELKNRKDLSEMTVGLLEWRYIPAFDQGEPLNLALHTTLAKSPNLFIDFLAMAYRPDDAEEQKKLSDQETRVAVNASRFLSTWANPPGTDDNGKIDIDTLSGWIADVRQLAKDRGYFSSCDYALGGLLGRFVGPEPTGETWPPAEICRILEGLNSRDMDESFYSSIRYGRGVVSRSMNEGGAQERKLAASFNKCAERVGKQWPRISGVLRTIAESYEKNAIREDSEVKRRDLGL